MAAQRVAQCKRKRCAAAPPRRCSRRALPSPLVLDAKAWRALTPAALVAAYARHDCLLLRDYVDDVAAWAGIESVAPMLRTQREAACVESRPPGCPLLAAEDFLDPARRGSGEPSWYVSFAANCPGTLLDALPLSGGVPAFLDAARARHHACAWFFIGHHPVARGARPLAGRPEHTDAIEHSGTWHLQLSGKKVWRVRRAERAEEAPTRLLCRAGDLLLVNTRLWAHHTELPSTLHARERVSVSCARDFFLAAAGEVNVAAAAAAGGEEAARCAAGRGGGGVSSGATGADASGADGSDAAMSNLEPLVATAALAKGEVVFALDDLPDCDMAFCQRPSCGVAMAEDGRVSLVALRDIDVGEWLTLQEQEEEEEERAE